jgi:hypothetical protein
MYSCAIRNSSNIQLPLVHAGASTSDVQSESLGLGSTTSKSALRPGFFGRVYQRRKLRKHHSSAVWRVKQGQTKPDAGTSQSREKVAVSSMIGEEDTSLASEEMLCGGEGEPKVLQLANRKSKEIAVSYHGLDSDGSRQTGLGSVEARESTDLGEKGSVVEKGDSLALLEEGGGLLLVPQVSSSQLCTGMGSSGFGGDLVDQRQEEGSLELVIFSSKEGKVGIESEATSVGPQVEISRWEGIGDKMETGSTFKGVVAEEGAHLECSLNLLEHFPEGLLLQDKIRNGKGKLESYEPMVITPLAVEGEDGQRVSPRWVVERIKRFYPIIGLSCGRFEDRLLALFEEIEVARELSLAEPKTNYLPSQGVKGQRELNRLAWSINYEKKGAHSVRGRRNGRGPSRLYDA